MNEKILVVDDEKEIADLLEVYLKNDNYIVHNRCISLLLFTTFYMPAWNLGTIWAPFT